MQIPRLFNSSKPGAVTNLLKYADQCDSLTPEEGEELLPRAKSGDCAAKARIIGSNLGFVVRLAQPASKIVPLEDLLQVCCQGCLKTIREFNPECGVRFITFLELTLRRPLQDAKRRSGVVRRLSNHMRKLAHDVEEAE